MARSVPNGQEESPSSLEGNEQRGGRPATGRMTGDQENAEWQAGRRSTGRARGLITHNILILITVEAGMGDVWPCLLGRSLNNLM